MLSPKAYQALHSLFQPFGEFLEVVCVNALGLLENPEQERETFYFYNVTNLLACIDAERSERRGSAIVKPVFDTAAIPSECQIFKDPLRVRPDIYLSTVAKESLADLIADAQIKGREIVLA